MSVKPGADLFSRKQGTVMMTSRMKASILEFAAVAAALGLFLAIGFWRLGATTFFMDEATRAHQAALSVAELLDALRDDIHPPLYMLLLHEWMRFWGGSDTALRALSLFFSAFHLVIVFVTWRALGVCLPQRAAALILLAASPAFVDYSRLAFSWPFFHMLVSGVVLCYVRSASTPSGWLTIRGGVAVFLCLVITGAMALYTNYIAGVVILTVFVMWMLQIQLWKRVSAARPSSPAWRWPIIWISALAGLFLPWLPVFIRQWSRYCLTPGGGPPLADRLIGILVRLGACGFQFLFGDSINPANWLAAGIGISCAAWLTWKGIVYMRSRLAPGARDAVRAYMSLQGAMFAACLAATSLVHGGQNPVFTPERMLFALPPLALIIGCGLAAAVPTDKECMLSALRIAAVAIGVALLHHMHNTGSTFLNWAYHTHWTAYSMAIEAGLYPKHAGDRAVVAFDNYSFGRAGERYLSGLGDVVPILDPQSWKLAAGFTEITSGTKILIWVQATRDASPGRVITESRDQAAAGGRVVKSFEFLSDSPAWHHLKQRLAGRKVEEHKIRAEIIVRQ